MDSPSPATRDLVQRLLAASQTGTVPQAQEAARVFETLRIHLTKLAGADGFTSLLTRAVALAKAEAPALASVTLGPGGQLEGLEAVEPDAAVALAAHLLGLLETFIGKSLTARIVREAWPDISRDE